MGRILSVKPSLKRLWFDSELSGSRLVEEVPVAFVTQEPETHPALKDYHFRFKATVLLPYISIDISGGWPSIDMDIVIAIETLTARLEELKLRRDNNLLNTFKSGQTNHNVDPTIKKSTPTGGVMLS